MIEVLANAFIVILLQSLYILTWHIVHFKITQYYMSIISQFSFLFFFYISGLKSPFREEILISRVAAFYHFKCIISNKTYKTRKQEYMIHTQRKKNNQ